VRMFVYDGFEMLDAIGPLETFANASMIGGGLYTVELVSRNGGTVRSSSGLALETSALPGAERPADTFLVSGGSGVIAACEDPETVTQVRRAMQAARRAGSVCTGAMLLARTGLLAGLKVVTHWNWCRRLAEENPGLDVEEDAIFLRSGALWTSAGVTAGIDMVLAMVEEDHGPGLALRTAQELVVYLRRPGGQSQFSAELKAQQTREPAIRRVLAAISGNPLADLRVEHLADVAGMSPRNFSRIFLKETGLTPAAFVTDIRIARACRLLETTGEPIDRIADRCGFSSDDALRRVFLRKKGCSPSAYRERFGSSG
jgi:transcriptional regulator GlxA family with amidase domain